MFLEFFQEGHPRTTTIASANENGDTAEPTVEGEVSGCMDRSLATAKIQMVKEPGAWKVKLESWKM